MMNIVVVGDVERLLNEMRMTSNGWMLKEISNRKRVSPKMKLSLVSMQELHEKKRMTTQSEDICIGRDLFSMTDLTP